jgi:hypothetical protein
MSKKINPLFYALALPLAAILALAGILFFRHNIAAVDAKPIDFPSYLQSWRTLDGNSYLVSCRIVQQLSYNEGKGRLLSVKLLDGPGTIAVFVPAEMEKGNTMNFETGQRYKMVVFLREDVPYVKKLEKF